MRKRRGRARMFQCLPSSAGFLSILRTILEFILGPLDEKATVRSLVGGTASCTRKSPSIYCMSGRNRSERRDVQTEPRRSPTTSVETTLRLSDLHRYQGGSSDRQPVIVFETSLANHTSQPVLTAHLKRLDAPFAISRGANFNVESDPFIILTYFALPLPLCMDIYEAGIGSCSFDLAWTP